jgi:hypothetical protein
VFLHKSLAPKLVGEDPQKRKELGVRRFIENRESSPVLAIIILLFSSLVECLMFRMAMQLSPVLRKWWQIFLGCRPDRQSRLAENVA